MKRTFYLMMAGVLILAGILSGCSGAVKSVPGASKPVSGNSGGSKAPSSVSEGSGDPYVARTSVPKAKTVVNPRLLTGIPSRVSLVDPKATKKTVNLYAYLKGIAASGDMIYGHQNDTTNKAVLHDAGTESDTKDMTGSLPGLCGIDALSMTGAELQLKPPFQNLIEETADVSVRAAKQGAVITLSAHMPNFDGVKAKGKKNGKYDYSGYTPTETVGNVAARILPGGNLNTVYTGYLDMIAGYAKLLGKADVPVLFRPFHENNGNWFWWGAGHCETSVYRSLYRYTVEYLRDKKGVHNFLYVFSPNGPFETEESYLADYPGDGYVDVLAFDYYDTDRAAGGPWFSAFSKTADVVAGAARKHGKLSAVAETGLMSNGSFLAVSGNADKNWFSEAANTLSGKGMAYFMTWANFGEADGFFEPYLTGGAKGHENVNGIIDFYNRENIVFANGVGDYSALSVKNVRQP